MSSTTTGWLPDFHIEIRHHNTQEELSLLNGLAFVWCIRYVWSGLFWTLPLWSERNRNVDIVTWQYSMFRSILGRESLGTSPGTSSGWSENVWSNVSRSSLEPSYCVATYHSSSVSYINDDLFWLLACFMQHLWAEWSFGMVQTYVPPYHTLCRIANACCRGFWGLFPVTILRFMILRFISSAFNIRSIECTDVGFLCDSSQIPIEIQWNRLCPRMWQELLEKWL